MSHGTRKSLVEASGYSAVLSAGERIRLSVSSTGTPFWRPILLGSVLTLLAACGVDVRNRARLQWAGQLTPEADPSACPPTHALLVLRDRRVTFTPDEGTWVLNGNAGPTTLEATRSRVTPDHKTYETRLEARWTEAAVEGVYTTPRCRYRVALSAF